MLDDDDDDDCFLSLSLDEEESLDELSDDLFLESPLLPPFPDGELAALFNVDMLGLPPEPPPAAGCFGDVTCLGLEMPIKIK